VQYVGIYFTCPNLYPMRSVRKRRINIVPDAVQAHATDIGDVLRFGASLRFQIASAGCFYTSDKSPLAAGGGHSQTERQFVLRLNCARSQIERLPGRKKIIVLAIMLLGRVAQRYRVRTFSGCRILYAQCKGCGLSALGSVHRIDRQHVNIAERSSFAKQPRGAFSSPFESPAFRIKGRSNHH